MRRIVDPHSALDSFAVAAGVTRERAGELAAVFRDCIDEVLADDGTLAVWPLFLATRNDPVARRLGDRYADATDKQRNDVAVGNAEEIAQWLEVDVELLDRFPIIGEFSLVIRILDRLGIDEKRNLDEAENILGVVHAWLDTFADGRRYRTSIVGLEKDLELWLITRLDRLRDLGYPVVLERQQLVLADRRRPDLVCRFTEPSRDAHEGDLLVIELKAGSAYEGAVDQLLGYIEPVRAVVAHCGEQVFGLLIADGASFEVQEYLLKSKNLRYLSLSALGYREALANRA